MTEPTGNMEQGDTIHNKQRCAGMSRIVKPNLSHIALAEQDFKMSCYIIRSNQFAKSVNTNMAFLVFAVCFSKGFFVFLQASFLLQQCISDDGNQGQRAAVRLRFHLLFVLILSLAVSRCDNYLAFDIDNICLKINSSSSQPENFASPKAIKSGK